MHVTRFVGLISCLLLLTDLSVAQERELLDEPRQLEQVRFSPPMNVSIRLTNGVRRTGRIVSISRESMVYQVGRDNNEVSVEIDDIRRVNTPDGEFTYEPANEDFERLRVKARQLSFLTVETVQTYEPPPEGFVPDDPPASPPTPDPTPGTVPPTGEGPTASETADLPPGSGDPLMQPTVELVPEEDLPPGSVVLFCGSCNGRLPLSIHNGDMCPHCQAVFYNEMASTRPGGASPPTGSGGVNPDSSGGAAYPTAPGGGQAGGAAVNSVPGSGDGGGGNVVARGTSFSDVPVWMKVGFFVGLVAIGWLILQRR